MNALLQLKETINQLNHVQACLTTQEFGTDSELQGAGFALIDIGASIEALESAIRYLEGN